MKALTLTQPWAQLVQLGAKTIETRSWPTMYRGDLAIHAAKGMSRADKELCGERPFRDNLEVGAIYSAEDLPRGCVIAIARLVKVVPTERWIDYAAQLTPGGAEYAFGDYSPGRYMWFLEDVRAIMPVPARGALGLWDWTGPRE